MYLFDKERELKQGKWKKEKQTSFWVGSPILAQSEDLGSWPEPKADT